MEKARTKEENEYESHGHHSVTTIRENGYTHSRASIKTKRWAGIIKKNGYGDLNLYGKKAYQEMIVIQNNIWASCNNIKIWDAWESHSNMWEHT